MILKKIISGGQTGADYTGISIAKVMGLEAGGHCPKGFRTDIGSRPELGFYFGLVETSDTGYVKRTHLNAANADGTVWFGNTSSPGYRCTVNGLMIANKESRFIVNPTGEALAHWIVENNIEVLNVAGNRARTNPDVAMQTRIALTDAIYLLQGEHQ